MKHTDQPAEVRNGEALDTARVEAFLHEAVPGLEGPMTVSQFPSGASNLTYLITVGEREMVLRRPPFGTKPKSGHDMHREYTVLKALGPACPYCPRPLAYTDGPDVIYGLGGNDVIQGQAGSDVICGGDGHDTLYSGDGNDELKR